MLDDLKFIHEKDAQDALGIVEKQWEQLSHEFEVPELKGTFENIVHSGMGGSALWALLSTSWPGYTVPFEVTRDYSVPSYVNEKTLFIASSYSGNTEETLSALALAEERNAYIVVITSGGKLADIAEGKKYPVVYLPKIDKPRYGAFYGWRALVLLVEQLGLTSVKNPSDELAKAGTYLKQVMDSWKPTVSTKNNLAKQTAQELMGKSVVMYSGRMLAPAAHKWKISFNENSKNIAWEYVFPEFNHNEFTGWTSHPTNKPYAIVYLQSPNDHERVKKRFDLSDKLLSGRWPSPNRIDVKGDGDLQQLLWAVALGDFTSLYLAFLNGTSPIDVGDKDIIERFKKELG